MSINPDEWAIHALLNRYTDAVNQRDWETYRACWTEDAVWELHAPINVLKTGIDDILAEARRAVESQSLFVQMNHAVTILGLNFNTAKVRVTLNEIGKANAGGGALPGIDGMFILAYYTDDLLKQEGAWKFKRRIYDVVYIDTTTPQGSVFPLRKY